MSLHDENQQDAKLTVRLSLPSDVADLAPRLRCEDMAEIVAATGEKPVVALGRGFADSVPCYTGLVMGQPAAMFGIVPQTYVHPKVGSIWLLGTEELGLFTREFVRVSTRWLEILSEGYSEIGNVVDERNSKHIRWLRWMGFKFTERIPEYGYLKLPFLRFHKILNWEPTNV